MTAVVAPGKAILCGEYAVLHGAPAVSVAVDRTVRAEIVPGRATAGSPFVDQARKMARSYCDRHRLPWSADPDLAIDSSALSEGAHKLGLGSSAAVTTAVLVASLAHAGQRLEDREQLFKLCHAAHDAAQGTRGSGIDVATSVYGGTILFRIGPGSQEATAVPIKLPPGVALTFVFTGKSASTPALLGQVRALAERDPAIHDALMARLTATAQAFVDACRAQRHSGLLEAVTEYASCLFALGEAAGAAIVTDEHRRVIDLAHAAGGAAKPSGAGGGDLAVAFTPDPESTTTLRRSLAEEGLFPLGLGMSEHGVRLES
jgi:phosphomevalonate kinase